MAAEYVKVDEDDSDKQQDKKKSWFSFKKLALFFIIFFVLSSIISGISFSLTPKIGVVPITGPISVDVETSVYGTSTSSREVSNTIRTLANDVSVEAIILDINSGGGSPVASEEISRAVEYARESKPVYAVINDVGASGAFWIAASANKTYASKMSIVGSIGVTSATLGFEQLIKEYNVTYRRQVAGEYKDMGSPFREPTQKEEDMIQDLLDEIHEEFISHLASSRNLDEEFVREYATGEVFLGSRALELGFIDEIGLYQDVIQSVKGNRSDMLVINYGPEPTLGDILGVNSLIEFPTANNNLVELR